MFKLLLLSLYTWLAGGNSLELYEKVMEVCQPPALPRIILNRRLFKGQILHPNLGDTPSKKTFTSHEFKEQ